MTAKPRYLRQIGMDQIRREGQNKLAQSTVAVIGCGGLGGPVLTYLALAGVGKLRLIEYDTVELSNLNRQFLYEEAQIGRKKCLCAGEFLKKRNSEVTLECMDQPLTSEHAGELLEGADVVVDCVDSIPTRRLAGRTCLEKGIPLVEGGIHGFYGYVMPVLPGVSACLECAAAGNFEKQDSVPALGAVAGVVGSLQAVECIKILLGQGEVHYGSLLQYDGLCSELTEVPIMPRKDCFCQNHKKNCKGRQP